MPSLAHGNDAGPAYIVAIKGQFLIIKPTRGATESRTIITRSVLLRVINAAAGEVINSGAQDTYPDLTSVGRLVTDLSTAGPRPPTLDR